MSWSLIAAALRTRATSDTGSGGLYETAGAAKVTGVYFIEAPQQTTQYAANFPYLLIVPVGDTEIKAFSTTSRFLEYGIQFSVFADKKTDITTLNTITDRIQARFDRWAPTITGWTANQLIREGGNLFDEGDSWHQAEDYRLALGK